MGAAKVASEVLTLEIQVESGPDKLGVLNFSLATIRIGRGPENDLVLASDLKVSRHHAEIQQHGADFYLVNLSTKNFILLNGHRIEKEKVASGDSVQIGDTVFSVKFQKPKPVAEKTISHEMPLAQQPMVFPTNLTPPQPQQKATRAPQVPPPLESPHFQVPGFQASGFEAPPIQAPPFPQNSGHRPVPSLQKDQGRLRFYLIVGAVGFLLYFFLFSDNSSQKKDRNAVTTRVDLSRQMEQSEIAITQLKSQAEKQNSVTYRRAQENLVRALRDFNQGQYSRAMEGFQVVLNLDPNNEMALRYRNLSATRLDQQVSEMMLQGARYLEKGNFRLCADAYGKAMILLQGRRDDPKYIQSKKFHEQCRLSQEGRL